MRGRTLFAGAMLLGGLFGAAVAAPWIAPPSEDPIYTAARAGQLPQQQATRLGAVSRYEADATADYTRKVDGAMVSRIIGWQNCTTHYHGADPEADAAIAAQEPNPKFYRLRDDRFALRQRTPGLAVCRTPTAGAPNAAAFADLAIWHSALTEPGGGELAARQCFDAAEGYATAYNAALAKYRPELVPIACAR